LNTFKARNILEKGQILLQPIMKQSTSSELI
jgi:hypothetical protein